MSLWDFARLAGSENLEEADRAAVLANALRTPRRLVRPSLGKDDFQLSLTPGVGLIWQNEKLNIVVLADAKLAELPPGISIPLGQTSTVLNAVNAAFASPPEWTRSIVVFAVSRPEMQISPGGAITGPSRGTIGTQVRWNSGSGFLTAGHVAPLLHASVHDFGSYVGDVVWTNDPTGHGGAVEPDVAVIELHSPVGLSNPIVGSTTAGPAAAVSILSSGISGVIMGISQFLFMASQNATCGDILRDAPRCGAPQDEAGRGRCTPHKQKLRAHHPGFCF